MKPVDEINPDNPMAEPTAEQWRIAALNRLDQSLEDLSLEELREVSRFIESVKTCQPG